MPADIEGVRAARRTRIRQARENVWRRPDGIGSPFGFVFMAAAIERVGQHMFSSEWTGREGLAWAQEAGGDEVDRFVRVTAEIAIRWQNGELLVKYWPKAAGGPPADIPAEWMLWAESERAFFPRDKAVLAANCELKGCWLGVERASLLTALNAIPKSPPTSSGVISTVKARSQCERWLAAEVKMSPNRRPKSRDAFKSEALAKFPGLSGTSFLEVWGKVASPAWRHAGAPRKNRED